MQNPGYIALSRQVALYRQMAVSANNIANLDTVGFKRQSMLFAEHLADAGAGDQASYVAEVGTFRDLSQGPLDTTGRQLDIAVNGEGYLAFETPGGVRYGRNGQLQLGADGQLQTRDGYRLLDADLAPVAVPPNTGKIKFTRDGAVLADGQQIAQLQATEFENPQSLTHTADGLYRASDDDPGAPAVESTIQQGVLERANVNSVIELVNLLEIQRDYQSTHNMTKGEHERLQRAIRELGRVEQS